MVGRRIGEFNRVLGVRSTDKSVENSHHLLPRWRVYLTHSEKVVKAIESCC